MLYKKNSLAYIGMNVAIIYATVMKGPNVSRMSESEESTIRSGGLKLDPENSGKTETIRNDT